MPKKRTFYSEEERKAHHEKKQREADLQIQELTKHWENDPKDIAEYLAFSTQFYKYSSRNTMLIYRQRPDSVFIASYTHWKELGYYVQEGEHGANIYRPETTRYFKPNVPNPTWVLLSKASPEQRHEVEIGMLESRDFTYFKPCTVFDISQTNCPPEDYPKLCGVGYNSTQHKDIYNTLCLYSEEIGVPVSEEDFEGIGTRGAYNPRNKHIHINQLLGDTQKLDTLLHEMSHHFMGHAHLSEINADATQLYEYKVEEINVPDKYRTPDAQTVTLTYGQTAEVSFYNQIARGSLEILKVDHDGVTPLEGAKFEITDDNGNVIATETSGPDGKIKVESILYGQYHWSEVKAPKGYDLDDTVHDFAIEHDEQVVEVTQENTPSVGSITAKKIDADGNAMPGVEFTLEYSTDDGATWAPVEARAEDSKPSIGGCTSAVVDGALETDENGVATFNGLQINNQTVTILYRLTETATKSGNTLLAAPMFIGSLPQVLDDGTEIVDVTVTAVNNQNYTLPSSGGNGMVSVPVGIALALISVSCFAAWLWKKKLF